MSKNYLLTWYGITDLRAALGFEVSDGPVLSALKTRRFTDAVVLGYSNQLKSQLNSDESALSSWAEWSESTEDSKVQLPRELIDRVIEVASNTSIGHEIFVKWLNRRLLEEGVNVRIDFRASDLHHLNDAQGIHQAASLAVRNVLEAKEEKSITLYVSPGTPVMAYTWALIARSNPHLDLSVLSSSNPKLPPEEIHIPRSLLTPSLGSGTSTHTQTMSYGLVIHLLGAQTLPVLHGIRQFESARHRIITSGEYRKTALRLGAETGIDFDTRFVDDPFKPGSARRLVEQMSREVGDDCKIAVNVTGGTKLMFAGALSACWELGLDPVYFEVRNHNMIFLREGRSAPLVGISDVEDFVRAAGFVVSDGGRWPSDVRAIRNQRLPSARQVWEQRESLVNLYRDRTFLAFSDKWNRHLPRHERDKLPFNFKWRDSEVYLTEKGESRLVLNGQEILFPGGGIFEFISGHWLEEFVYSLLSPLLEEGVIRDLRVGMEVGYQQHAHSDLDTFSELDCVFTDGKRLWIIECKAGAIRQEAIQKLENNVRVYGGVSAKGLFVSAQAPKGVHRRRLESSTMVSAVDPRRLSTDSLRALILES